MKAESAELLKSGARLLGTDLSDEQMAAFDLLLGELERWNRKLNLTAISEEREIVIYHFLDSLSCLLSSKIREEARLLDIGTGAGFPGIPVAIARPDISVSLLESMRKKGEFLKNVISLLGLKARVLVGRAEELARTPERASYDVVAARAVAALPVLCEYALPFLKKGGYLVAQKSKRVREELREGERAAALIGGGKPEVVSVSLPFAEAERYLVIVEKIKETPERYPRRAGIPPKRPLGRLRK
jgi:16S rRNA (guanine527-N7)-methyltransferase